MSEVLEKPPVRVCYGCGLADDAPKFTNIVDMADVTKDEPYHYDCIPAGVRKQHGIEDSAHPAHGIFAACAKGTKDDALQSFAAKHVKTLKEAPADKTTQWSEEG